MDVGGVDEAIVLGSWIGRKQAFSGMAGRCTAADAHCLRTLREEKKYKSLGLSWDEFCARRLGISRSMADRTIRLFEEFGETYFYLNGLIPIAPEDYRRIAGSVGANGVQHGGEAIAIAPQNTLRLAAAVQDLKRQARPALPAGPPESPVTRATNRLTAVVGELERLLADGPADNDLAALSAALLGTAARLDRLNYKLHP